MRVGRPCVWIAVLMLGCGADDGDDGSADDTGGTTTMGSATAPTTSGTSPTATMTDGSTSASSSGAADDAPAETSTGGGASSGPAEDSSGPADDSEGGGNSCTPDAADDACRECVKANCCDDWIACANDEVCACTIDCHLAGASLGSCKNQCGGDPETYEAVYFCGQMFCLGTCDWDCC